MKIVVWVATNAFLYLPVYAMDKMGILERVAKALRNGDNREITFDIRLPEEVGDQHAIEQMLEASQPYKSNELHIAIGDPLAIVEVDPQGKKARVFGAFLKKPPFWVIGTKEAQKHKHLVEEVIIYDPKFATGYKLGKAYKHDKYPEVKSSKLTTKFLGEEINELFEEEIDETGGVVGTRAVDKKVAVSADIVGLARAMSIDKNITVIDKLSKKYPDFVTTGIITSKNALSGSQREWLGIFSEALRVSCAFINTAQHPTANLVRELSRDPRFQNQIYVGGGSHSRRGLSQSESNQVAEIIFEEKMYETSLEISKKEWVAAAKSHNFEPVETKKAIGLYRKAYEPMLNQAKLESWMRYAMPEVHARVWVRNSVNALVLYLCSIVAYLIIFYYKNNIPQNISSTQNLLTNVLLLSTLLFSVTYLFYLSVWNSTLYRKLAAVTYGWMNTEFFQNSSILLLNILIVWGFSWKTKATINLESISIATGTYLIYLFFRLAAVRKSWL